MLGYIVLKAKEDSEIFMKSKEYNDPKYSFIKQSVIQSANLD